MIFAESAISINLVKNHELIEEALTFYITLKPKANQFLARSYLCHAHLHKPFSTRELDKLQLCSSYILKAIEFGTKNSRYYFLVVNASILFWKLARPFLVLQSIHHVCGTLGAIVKALTFIDDHNQQWLISVSVSYIESLYRSNQIELATKEANTAIKLAKEKSRGQLVEVISKLSSYGLVTAKDMADLPLHLVLIYEINSLKSCIKVDRSMEKNKVSKTLSGVLDKILQNITDLDCDTRNELLLEALAIALQHRLPELAQKCLDSMNKPFTDVNFEFRVKFAEADLILKKLGGQEESYKKSILDVRVKSIMQCQDALVTSMKDCDSLTVQTGCITLWNLCLPMLQHNLRKLIIEPLKLIVTALEEIQSMLVLLRCQVHIELAKCYQDQQKLIEALENFNKALVLDPNDKYKKTILYHIKCIDLKTNLYKRPDTIEEKAGFLLEQAKSAKDAKAKLQPILLKVGEYLAPHTFSWGIKELGENSQNCSSFIVLRDKMIKYREAKEKGVSEMNRLSEENTHERFILWADTTKLARKEEVWDVALTAARYALWFEDRYSYQPSEDDESVRKSNNSRASSMRSDKIATSKPAVKKLSNFEKSNAILLAELNFILAESLIYFLMQEKIALGEGPRLPKQIVANEADLIVHIDYQHWEGYCNWVKEVQQECIDHFIKGGTQGIALKEWWLVNNSCVYIWNYMKQTIDRNNHSKVIGWLAEGYNLLMSSKGGADFVLVCQFAEALVQGYLTKHKVAKLLIGSMSPSASRPTSQHRKSAKKPETPAQKKGGKKDAKDAGPTLDPVLVEDISKAMQITEVVYQQIVGNENVGLQKRKTLLCLWVKCKQVLAQPLKNLLPDDENTDRFSVACKSIVAVEMNHMNTNQYYIFPNTPTMQETLKMIDTSEWSDKLIELEIWTKLASLSLKLSNKELIDNCCKKISELQNHPHFSRPGSKITANKLLCYHNLILAKSELLFTNKTTIEDRLPALSLFTTAALAAEQAKDYGLAMEVMQHFWNAILPHLHRSNERAPLKDDLLQALKVIANLAPDKNQKLVEVSSKQQKEIDLRAHLYGSLFIIFLDEKDWSSGLEEAEKAALSMPRPTHPLILKYRALFKVNLGLSPNGDLAKLERIESEDIVSDMWGRVAMSSSSKEEQLYALQQSIMLLQHPMLRIKKIDCITRFAEWLFINQYSINDVLDQLEWALDIAVGLNSEEKGSVLMPYEGTEEGKSRSIAHTQSVTRTRQTMSTLATSLSEEKVEVISKPKPLLSYVDEVMEHCEEMIDIQRGELIARILVMRSKMVLYSGGNVKQTMILAYKYYKDILQTCLSNTEAPSPVEDKPTTGDGKRKGKGNTSKTTSKAHVQSFCCPESLSEWSVFKLPEGLAESLKDKTDSLTVNKITFPQPELSLYYIDELCKQMKLFGFVDHLLPLYALQELLAVTVLADPHLAGLVHYKAAWACQKLQLLQGFNHHIDVANSAHMSEEFVANQVDLELYKSGIKQPIPLPMGLSDDSDLANNIISEIKLCDIQIEKAELFIETGDFKSAITMLELALPGIEFSCGNRSLARYHRAAALLAASQANYNSALEHFLEIQKSSNDLDTSGDLMIRIMEVLVRTSPQNAEAVSIKFIKILQELQAKYKNHSCQIQYIISHISCLVVRTKIDTMLTGNMALAEVESLLTLCGVFDKPIQIFSTLGFNLDACWAMLWLSKVKFRLSIMENNTDFHKCMFLEAIESSQNALKLTNKELNVMTNLGVGQGKMSLYVKSIIELNCHLSNMYHQISTDVIAEEKRFRIADSQKNDIDKKIESYIAEPILLSSLDERWQKLCYSAMELCKTHADNAVRLCQKHHLEYNAKSQFKLCVALGDTSISFFEDSLDQWNIDLSGQEIVTRDVHKEIISLKYLTSSMEFLVQSVQISLLKQDHVMLQSACLEALNRLGYNSPHISAQFLALYQSSVTSAWLRKLLKQALHWPSKSEIGSLVVQLERAYESKNYQLYSQCFEELTKTNSSWKKLLVFENHFDLLKEVDEKQYFLILQHSPCKKYLYSALVQGSKTSGKNSLDNPVMKISRTEVSYEKLESVQRMYEAYKANVHKFMIRLVHYFKLETQTEERRILLNPLGVVESGQAVEDLWTSLEEEKAKNNLFYYNIISNLWSYLSPAVQAFNQHFSSITDEECNMVLLADISLQQLPLEALPISKIGALKLFTRDFSLQTFFHRMVSYTHAKNAEAAVAGTEPKKGHKTPTGSAKGERIKNPLEKRLMADKISLLPPVVDSNNFKYIVNDDGGVKCGNLNMTTEVGEMLKVTQTKTARWTGTLITNSQVSPVEVQEILHGSSGFLYCGLGKISGLISSELLTCLNLNRSHVHILADKVTSAHSLRYETKADQDKDKKLLELETSLHVAGLLYLNGSVLTLINSGETNSDSNVKFVCSLVKTAVEGDCSIGNALHLTRFPAPPEPPLPQPVTPVGKGKAKAAKAKPESTQDQNTRPPLEIKLPESLDPSVYNMAAFGVPHVTLGDPIPNQGKK